MDKLSNTLGGIIIAILFVSACTPTTHAIGLGSLLGGGGDPVKIVSDTSKTGITNVLKNTLSSVSTAATAAIQNSLQLKELTLDGIAWSMSKQLQQQLTGNMLKWVNSGVNGEPAFIQNYSNYYEKIADAVAGEVIFSGADENYCDEKKKFQSQALQLENYTKTYKQATYQCTINDDSNGGVKRNPLSLIFETVTNCTNDPFCDSLQKDVELYTRILDAQLNEKQVIDNTRGFLPTRVCESITTAAGTSKLDCKIVTPPSLTPDTVSYTLGQLPLEQLLNTDEFNEIVSGFMSNLTNQAITGINGVLGLGGNSQYSNNTFGTDGNLSYADALIQDDISQYQTYNANPIKDALKTEARYAELEKFIFDTVTSLEAKLAANKAEFPSCFDMELSDELVQVKADTTANLSISSTTTAILNVLDQQFDDATDSGVRNAVISTFVDYQKQGFFRTDYDNQELEISYINLDFAELVDTFRYDTAVARVDCGGDFDYVDKSTTSPTNGT